MMRLLMALILICLTAAPSLTRPVNILTALASINRECIQFVSIPNSCLFGTLDTVSYWRPKYLVAVTNKTGVPVLLGLGSLAGVIAGASAAELAGGGALNAAGTNKHFLEARVYTIPSSELLGCTACDGPNDDQVKINYVSDIDHEWRDRLGFVIPGLTELGLPLIAYGRWGLRLPRSGMIIHGSQVVAAALASARALSIVNNPVEVLPTPSVRPVIDPDPEPSSCFQVVHPLPSHCFPTGANPIHFETLRLEEEASYVFVYWVLKGCCVDSSESNKCLAYVGGSSNFCLNPMEPLTGIVLGAPIFN